MFNALFLLRCRKSMPNHPPFQSLFRFSPLSKAPKPIFFPHIHQRVIKIIVIIMDFLQNTFFLPCSIRWEEGKMDQCTIYIERKIPEGLLKQIRYNSGEQGAAQLKTGVGINLYEPWVHLLVDHKIHAKQLEIMLFSLLV